MVRRTFSSEFDVLRIKTAYSRRDSGGGVVNLSRVSLGVEVVGVDVGVDDEAEGVGVAAGVGI